MVDGEVQVPWQVLGAIVAGGLSAALLGMWAVVAWSVGIDDPRGAALLMVPTALSLGQGVGVVLLHRQRGWRALVVTSAAVAAAAPVWLGAVWAEEGLVIGPLAVVLLGPVLAAVLAGSASARRWIAARRPARRVH